ncbi:MAG: hypothetical protein ABJA89_06685 [Lapillicoccus sp.]
MEDNARETDEDADQGAFDGRETAGHEMQAACDAVLAAGLGTDRDAIRARLQEELTRAGHWPQPEPWLEAVVEETQLGHHYRVI